MAFFRGPRVVQDGLVLYMDAANPKSFSPNVHPYPKDLYSWVTTGSNMVLSRDTIISSPVGSTPLKIITVGINGYMDSYNNNSWNLAPTVFGETWTVSFWVKGSPSTIGYIFIFGANSSGNYIEIGTPTFNITSDWTRVSGSYTMANYSTSFIQVRLDCYTDATTFWVDGMQVEKRSSLSTFNPIVNINGTNWWDLSKNNNHGELINEPTFDSDNMGSLVFDGIDDYVTVPNSSELNLTAYGTVSVWFYHSSNTSEDFGGLIGIAPSGGAGGGSYVMFWSAAYGNVIRASISDLAGNLNAVSMGIPRFKMWCNCTFTWDGTMLTMYRDGISVCTAWQTLNPQVLMADLNIGRTFGNNSYCFAGYISNTSVYNRALSAGEVLQNYNALRERYTERIVTDGLVLNLDAGKDASYPGAGTILTDLSGTGNNGTLVNGPSYDSTNAGSIVFDGINDYVYCGNSQMTHRTSNFTYSAWVNHCVINTYNTYFENGLYTGGLLIRPTSVGIHIYSQGVHFGTFPWVPSTNTWYHVAFIRNGNTLYFYLDGLVSATMDFTADVQPTTNYLYIGASQHSVNQVFNGNISNAMVYSRGLSAAEILQNYNALKHRYI